VIVKVPDNAPGSERFPDGGSHGLDNSNAGTSCTRFVLVAQFLDDFDREFVATFGRSGA
jgi:hypothetical protein